MRNRFSFNNKYSSFSCTDKDGDWDPMIWNNKNNIEVPQAGKSYIFMNYNYESFGYMLSMELKI